ncbi:copper resistance CopC/CopD family protein [Rhizobium rhizogenes]|uniref:copper resistance CopC/CopD family protein n=1 Tax=Rhizobium rhizogenes TaxID=359 RepID=UPI0024BDE3D6|nr:CopD family protein [Rhizobium rhizogenes]MDJ1637584.1 copper resistance protein CopC [Rhizobium rhizogenes]
MKAVRRFFWAAVFCILYLGPLAMAAFAHASLITSDPFDAAVLPEGPPAITLQFSEPVTPLVARLIHPNGEADILQDDGGKGATVTYELPSDLERGTHILSWRVTSSDGHPISGGQIFSVGAPSAAGASVGGQSDLSVRIGLWAARLLLMLGLIFGAGSVIFSTFARLDLRSAARHAVSALIVLGLLAGPALIGFQGLDALGESLPGLARSQVWSAGLWSTAYGRATMLAATALLLALIAHHSGSRARQWLSAAILLVAGGAFASAGHAATAPPRLLTTPAIFLHVLSVIAWIGALIPLTDVIGRRDGAAAGTLRRFSSAISAVVLVLVITGLFLAAVQLNHVSALWTTQYGLVLLAKLGLVALLLLLAAVNRYRLTEGAIAGETLSLRHLKRSILAEMAIAVAILAVLGLWRFTPPPRAILESTPPLAIINAQKDGLSARLTLRPALVGPVTVEIDDLQLDGKTFEPISISLDLEKPAYGIGPFTHTAIRGGEGHFTAGGFFLPIDGFWIVRATVLVSDFRSVILTDIFDVRKPAANGNSLSSAAFNSQ